MMSVWPVPCTWSGSNAVMMSVWSVPCTWSGTNAVMMSVWSVPCTWCGTNAVMISLWSVPCTWSGTNAVMMSVWSVPCTWSGTNAVMMSVHGLYAHVCHFINLLHVGYPSTIIADGDSVKEGQKLLLLHYRCRYARFLFVDLYMYVQYWVDNVKL